MIVLSWKKEKCKKTWNCIDKEMSVWYNKSTIKLGKATVMDKEKILESARKNGDRGNEYELRENTRASLVSFLATLSGIMLLLAIDYFKNGLINISLIIVGAIAMGAECLYSGIVFGKKIKALLGAITLLIALIMIVDYMVML